MPPILSVMLWNCWKSDRNLFDASIASITEKTLAVRRQESHIHHQMNGFVLTGRSEQDAYDNSKR